MSQHKIDWDPTEPVTVEDRLAQMAQTRARCPVAFAGRHGGQWDLLRYDDIVAVAADPARFSNAGASRYNRPLPPLEFDPPLHGEYRRLLAIFFSLARMQALEAKVRPVAVEIIDRLVANGEGDLAKELSYPLPVIGLCALLNISSQHWRDIKTWSENTLLMDSDRESDRELAIAGHEKIIAFAGTMIAERRRNPMSAEDDITSALLAARIGGAAMDDDLIARTLRILISAGHNSTTSAIGNSLLYLMEHPEAQDKLRRNPKLIPGAIEEFLRCDTPVQEMPRWATQDVTIGGRFISAGDRIGMFWAAGNRDESTFPDADQYVLDRKSNRHLAFGRGIHTCLGAPMARMQIRVALEEMLARTETFSPAGTAARAKFHRMGVISLPAQLRPARR
jgi:cytochrome P450